MNLKPFLFFIFVIYFVFLNGAENGYKYWKKANQLFEQKKYQEALIYYDKIDKSIDILDVKINSARCFYFLEKFSEAENAYQKIIEIPNINLDVYKEYANILIKNGKANEAKIWDKKYIEENIKQQKFITEIPAKPTKEISNKTKEVSNKKYKEQKDTTAKIIKTPKVKPNKNTIKIEKLKVVIQKDTTSKVIKMPKVKADKIPALIYKIKLATVLVDPGAKNFENISSFGQITFTKIANQTIYYIGNYKSYLEAVKYLQKIITQGYSKAYITPFYLDKEISISEAIEKENK